MVSWINHGDNVMSNSTFIIGGARSGKSRFALSRAEQLSTSPVFIATAEALDDEMRKRIARHQSERGQQWSTLECPVDLCGVLATLGPHETILIDCLTLWLSNLMHRGCGIESEVDRLCECISSAPQNLVCVANEVGLGLVPETQLGREFRDAQGLLNQAVAQVADEVYFVAAGLPLQLK